MGDQSKHWKGGNRQHRAKSLPAPDHQGDRQIMATSASTTSTTSQDWESTESLGDTAPLLPPLSSSPTKPRTPTFMDRFMGRFGDSGASSSNMGGIKKKKSKLKLLDLDATNDFEVSTAGVGTPGVGTPGAGTPDAGQPESKRVFGGNIPTLEPEPTTASTIGEQPNSGSPSSSHWPSSASIQPQPQQSLLQMVEDLQVAMFTKSCTKPLPRQYDGNVYHLLEGFRKQHSKIGLLEQEIAEWKEQMALDLDKFVKLSEEWLQREKGYKLEIRRIEKILVDRTDGVQSVLLTRSNSLINRTDTLRFSNKVESFVAAIRERLNAPPKEDPDSDEDIAPEGGISPPESWKMTSLRKLPEHRRLADVLDLRDPDLDLKTSQKFLRETAMSAAESEHYELRSDAAWLAREEHRAAMEEKCRARQAKMESIPPVTVPEKYSPEPGIEIQQKDPSACKETSAEETSAAASDQAANYPNAENSRLGPRPGPRPGPIPAAQNDQPTIFLRSQDRTGSSESFSDDTHNENLGSRNPYNEANIRARARTLDDSTDSTTSSESDDDDGLPRRGGTLTQASYNAGLNRHHSLKKDQVQRQQGSGEFERPGSRLQEASSQGVRPAVMGNRKRFSFELGDDRDELNSPGGGYFPAYETYATTMTGGIGEMLDGPTSRPVASTASSYPEPTEPTPAPVHLSERGHQKQQQQQQQQQQLPLASPPHVAVAADSNEPSGNIDTATEATTPTAPSSAVLTFAALAKRAFGASASRSPAVVRVSSNSDAPSAAGAPPLPPSQGPGPGPGPGVVLPHYARDATAGTTTATADGGIFLPVKGHQYQAAADTLQSPPPFPFLPPPTTTAAGVGNGGGDHDYATPAAALPEAKGKKKKKWKGKAKESSL